ncbi:MAG TPA: inverse autotransporter beta domain-containing protein [Nitrospinota bacterium]|nr:inverse autotransporter beta domain-containing protein [Nitrospinota bacterium]
MQDHTEPLKKACYFLKVCLGSSLYLFLTNICLIVFLFIPSLSFAEPSFNLPKEKQPLTEWLSKMSPDVRVEQKSQNYYIDNIFSLNLSGIKPNPNSPQSPSLQEWPTKISPGIRGGNGRTLYYVDGLIPFFRKKNSLFFANPKAVFGSNDTEEMNIGMGYRHLLYNDRMFLGINGYFDTQRSENNFRHNQFGLGLEAIITEWFDLRSNFYFPVSGKRTLPDSVSYRFAQRSFLSHTINNLEEPLRGLDYEGGVLIPGISDIIETRAYFGGYYYDSEIGDDIDGIKGRIEIRPFPLLAINVEIRDDNAFETDILVGGYISIPLSFKGWKDYWKKRGKRKPRERMTDLVVRDIDVVSNKSTRDLGESKVYDMVYVNNSNTGDVDEDGSLDHPYDEMTEGLSALSDGETLYVFQGSKNYEGNFTVSNQNTIIWGEGHEAFPGCGGDDHYPVLDGNAAGDVFTVSADNVEIRGLQIQNSGSRGIHAENRNGGNIHHNILTNNGSGLSVWSNILDNTVSNWTVANNTISNNSNYGIYFYGAAHLSNFVFSRNRLINNENGFRMTLNSSPTISNFTFTNNTITGNTNYGININEESLHAVATFNNVNFGDASAGTGGYNSIYNNGTADFYEATNDSFTAQNNYWGGEEPKLVVGNNAVNYTPWLTTDPN